MKACTILPAKKVGWYYASFPFHPGANKLVKSVPGVRWSTDHKSWAVPFDCVEYIKAVAVWAGFEVVAREHISACGKATPNPVLYPYQNDAVARMLRDRRVFLNFEMGLGKTPTTIEALKQAGVNTALIVCPAIVRGVWEDELQRWWPDAPIAQVVRTGKEAKDIYGSFVITSYELVGKLNKMRQFEAYILDEAHYVKNHDTKRTKDVQNYLELGKPSSFRFFLTGTPIANEPIDLWAQGELLVKGMYGRYYHFRKKYADSRPNEHAYSGVEYYGLHPINGKELKSRVSSVSIRKTKAEVQHLLPKLTVTPMRIKARRSVELALKAIEEGEDLIAKATDEKLKAIIELVRSDIESGVTHTAVLCHLKRTAEVLGQLLDGAVITGDVPEKKRHELLKELSEETDKPAILCATMHSLSTGLSLNAFTNVIYAELDWRHSEVSQSMARYHRVSGTAPVTVKIPVLEGTFEEVIAETIAAKLADVKEVVQLGAVEEGLTEALEGNETFTDEDIREAIRLG